MDRIKREQAGREIEIRVSTMPTAFGEKAVLRIFDPIILLKGIDELGLSSHDLPKFHDFIAQPTGIILITGPTGSGKTTRLYSSRSGLPALSAGRTLSATSRPSDLHRISFCPFLRTRSGTLVCRL